MSKVIKRQSIYHLTYCVFKYEYKMQLKTFPVEFAIEEKWNLVKLMKISN